MGFDKRSVPSQLLGSQLLNPLSGRWDLTAVLQANSALSLDNTRLEATSLLHARLVLYLLFRV